MFAKPNEFAEGHITGAINIPLSDMADPGSMAQIKEDDNRLCPLLGWLQKCNCFFSLKTTGYS
jgi:3-mercaptopyruvate sulfurtransferase SseA